MHSCHHFFHAPKPYIHIHNSPQTSQPWHTFSHSFVNMSPSTHVHEMVRFIHLGGHIGVICGHSYSILRLSLLLYLFGGFELKSRHRSDKIDHFNPMITYYYFIFIFYFFYYSYIYFIHFYIYIICTIYTQHYLLHMTCIDHRIIKHK